MTYLRRRAGIVLTPHQFRHLSAKIVLDLNPGNTKLSNNFLDTGSIKTTVDAYAGIHFAGRRGGISISYEQALATEMPSAIQRRYRERRPARKPRRIA